MARPSSYTEKIADEICEAIANGAALYRLCDENNNLPHEATVYRWLESEPTFREKYVRARERQQDREIDHIVAIADEATDANLARLRIDARKWRASKLHPKKYGDRLDLEHSGGVRLERIERVIVDPQSTDPNR